MPKPFLPLVGSDTLFTATLLRCPSSQGFSDPIIVAGSQHVGHVEGQLVDPDHSTIIVEPEARNTAAAIALAALSLEADTLMLVCPSDHYISDEKAFITAAHNAAQLAAEGWLVSFGIVPTAPETGFGYLEMGDAIPGSAGFKVSRFVEKPDLDRAIQFLATGNFAWNGGIFCFRAGTFLEELGLHRPDILRTVKEAFENGYSSGKCFHPCPSAFATVPSESVDYAVMENTAKAAMVPAEMGWSDIGNWSALQDACAKDTDGNAVQGRAELLGCTNVLAVTDGPRVSVVGASNLVVVVDGDEVMVCTREGAQSVGKLTGAAKQ